MPSSWLWRSRFRPGENRPGRKDPGVHQDPDSAGGRSLRPGGNQDLEQADGELGIVEKTVKVHRARGMEAMRAGSLAELVQLGRRSGCHRGQVMSVSALASDVATDRVGPRSHLARNPVQYDALDP